MTIHELIEKLYAIQVQHGDLPVHLDCSAGSKYPDAVGLHAVRLYGDQDHFYAPIRNPELVLESERCQRMEVEP